MAEKLHLVHVKSNVYGKAPSAATINYGEIAVNYNTNTPALYIRDSADKIVKFIAEPYFLRIVGTGVTENDGTITPISEIIQQDEETISAAFNDLNDRKADKSYVDEAVSSITIDVDSELDSASTNPVENRAIYGELVDCRPRMFYGTCSDPASATTKTVACSAFTSEDLTKGVIMYVTFNNTNSAAVASLKMNVNSTSDKPIKKTYCGSAPSNLTTSAEIQANQTYMFEYDGTNWVCMTLDYNSTYDLSRLQEGAGNYTADSVIYRYQMLFQKGDDERNELTPLNNNSNATGTSKTLLTNVEFDAFGKIYYYATTTTVSANTKIIGSNLFYHYAYFDLRYTFNITTSTFTANEPLYLVVLPQSNGLVKLASTTPYTQTLPSTNDGRWYIFLGMMYDGYRLNLHSNHPVFKYDGTEIVQVTNPEIVAGLKDELVNVDSQLDSASTNPVENRAIYKAIVDDEKAIAAAINDLNDRKADISYVDDAITSITIDVDSVLDSASTNPLENRAIYQILEEDEIAISAALNDLNDRKADKEYVDEAISGVTIDTLDYIDSASTMPVESQAIWHRFDEDERITAYALNDLNTRLLGCESGLTTELSSNSTDAEWPTAKATYDEIHPKKENSVPEGGLYPNVYYNLGVLSGNTTISFATPFDQTVENEYRFRFTAATPAPTIIWPNSITKWAGNCLDKTTSTPIITDGNIYEVSALDGLAIIIVYE